MWGPVSNIPLCGKFFWVEAEKCFPNGQCSGIQTVEAVLNMGEATNQRPVREDAGNQQGSSVGPKSVSAALEAGDQSGSQEPADGSPSITREQRRSRRKRDVRARTISVKRMTRREIEIARRNAPPATYDRPLTRAECVNGPRPCPYISCKYHLYLDVSPRTGSIKLNFPDLDPWEMPMSCALDVADSGGSTLEDVGAIMNLTRERIRQLEVKALSKLEALRDMAELRELADDEESSKRRLPTVD